MAVAPRRPALAVMSGALAAVALAVAMNGRGCGIDENSPEGVVRAFVAAAAADDREMVLELLGPVTRARLEQAAQRATERVGGSGRYDAVDMVSVGRFTEEDAPQQYRVIERADDRAVVEVVGKGDLRGAVIVTRVDGRWRIEHIAYGGGL